MLKNSKVVVFVATWLFIFAFSEGASIFYGDNNQTTFTDNGNNDSYNDEANITATPESYDAGEITLIDMSNDAVYPTDDEEEEGMYYRVGLDADGSGGSGSLFVVSYGEKDVGSSDQQPAVEEKFQVWPVIFEEKYRLPCDVTADTIVDVKEQRDLEGDEVRCDWTWNKQNGRATMRFMKSGGDYLEGKLESESSVHHYSRYLYVNDQLLDITYYEIYAKNDAWMKNICILIIVLSAISFIGGIVYFAFKGQLQSKKPAYENKK